MLARETTHVQRAERAEVHHEKQTTKKQELASRFARSNDEFKKMLERTKKPIPAPYRGQKSSGSTKTLWSDKSTGSNTVSPKPQQKVADQQITRAIGGLAQAASETTLEVKYLKESIHATFPQDQEKAQQDERVIQQVTADAGISQSLNE